MSRNPLITSYLKMRHRRDSSGSLVPKAVPGGKKEAALREHSSCSQVKGDTRTQTYANLDQVENFARKVMI